MLKKMEEEQKEEFKYIYANEEPPTKNV